MATLLNTHTTLKTAHFRHTTYKRTKALCGNFFQNPHCVTVKMCDGQRAAFGYTDRFYPRTRIKCPHRYNFLKCSKIYFRVSVCSQQVSPPFYKRKAFLHRLPGWDSSLVKRGRSHWIDDSKAVHRARLLVANVTKTTLDAHGCCASPNL